MGALTWRFLNPYRDVGLLVIRVGLGLSFMVHGWPKLIGGPDKWTGLGGAMSTLGISVFPMFWGLSAAVTELVGGALLVIGLGTRPVSALLAFTMFVAFMMHFQAGDGFRGYSHALEDGVVFLGLILLGAGKYSLDAKIRG